MSEETDVGVNVSAEGYVDISISPSAMTVQKAWRLGRSLAMTDPAFQPDLDDAANFANYVLFMLAHRKKMELLPGFWTWDLRLEDIIEDEVDRKGLTLNPDNVEEILRVIANPIRCAFWFGWEQVHNLQERYEKATGNRTESPSLAISTADIQASAADLRALRPEAPEQEVKLDPATRIIG